MISYNHDARPNYRHGNTKGALTALAMAMGYNIVQNTFSDGRSYYTVLDRSALTTGTKNYYTENEH